MENKVKTLADAIRYFSDEQVCIDTVAGMRWLDGRWPCLPQCNAAKDRQHWLKNQRRWQCRECGKQYSVKVRTIFEDSPIPLRNGCPPCGSWRTARTAFSSTRWRSDIGVTQKSAWFMLHRIREAMKRTRKHKFGFGGPVEVRRGFHRPQPSEDAQGPQGAAASARWPQGWICRQDCRAWECSTANSRRFAQR